MTDLSVTPERRLLEIGVGLPSAPEPIANFLTCRQSGNLLFLSGQGPREADGTLHIGTVGASVTVEEAYRHARLTGINLLAVMRDALGSLDRVERVVKLLGLVNAAPDFGDHPKVINGCSDLFVEVFGLDRGRGARSAIGCGSLPDGQTVEIEAIVEVRVHA